MKRLLLLSVVILTASPAFAQTAAEKAEKRLEELLTIGRTLGSGLATQPIVWKRANLVEAIEFVAEPHRPKLARLPATPRKELRPPGLSEGRLLSAFVDRSPTPVVVVLTTQPLIKLPEVDVASPAPIPILSRPVKDRASLGDPAFDLSLESSMKAFTVTRDRPLPFTAVNIPDPFENMRHGQLRNPPEESASPANVPWRKPQ